MGDNRILVSNDTKELIGKDVLAFLNEQGIKPTAIFSKTDFESDSFFGWVADQAKSSHILAQAGIPQFIDDDLSQSNPSHNTLKKVFQYATSKENNAYNLNVSIATKKTYDDERLAQSQNGSDINISTYPNIDSFVEYISATLKIPEEHISPLVHNSSRKDHLTHSLFHEVGHTDPKQDGMTISEQEFNAGLHANELYKAAFAKGIVSDPNIPEIDSYARAMIHFTRKLSSDYAYNGTIDPDKNTNHIEHGAYNGKPYEFINDAVNTVFETIAAPFQSTQTEFDALYNIDLSSLSDNQQDTFHELQSSYTTSLEEIETFMDGVEIPADQQEAFELGIKQSLQNEGRELSKDQPELIYDTAKAKLMNGDYDHDTAIKNQMENFVIGAERIAPTHFNIEGTPYLDYLETIGRNEDITSGLIPAPQTPIDQTITMTQAP